MDLTTVIILALALCVDSFAVSISSAVACGVWQRNRGVRFALILGVMQGLMPLLGWLIGSRFNSVICNLDHWIALILLGFIGGKMIIEGSRKNSSEELKGDPFQLRRTILTGFATSIDAIAAGILMGFLTINIVDSQGQFVNMLLVALIVAVITFIASIFGLLIGLRVKGSLGHKAEIVAGIVLIAIGLKIFIEHLFFE